jgi:hypothetical protein
MRHLHKSSRHLALSILAVLALAGCAVDTADPSSRDASLRDGQGNSGLGTAELALAGAADDFNFGPHAVDQCVNPIATVSNSEGSFGAQDTILDRGTDGICRSEKGYCVGDCVRVVVKADGGRQSRGINVIVASNLPDPGNCSDVAIDTNDPPGSWDFTHAGACGKGASGDGYWHNCFVHDVCVWARCTDDDLIAGGLSIRGTGGIDDQYCGKAFDDARKDFVFAHIPVSCLSDAMCPEGTDCKAGTCRQRGLPEGSACYTDADCDGYCQLLRCYDGSEGDRCGEDADCQGDLTCIGARPNGTCKRPKAEGGSCGSDADCQGYCQFLRCWDGSKGDKCRSTSDCQGSLQCKPRCRICAQKTCQ